MSQPEGFKDGEVRDAVQQYWLCLGQQPCVTQTMEMLVKSGTSLHAVSAGVIVQHDRTT